VQLIGHVQDAEEFRQMRNQYSSSRSKDRSNRSQAGL